MFDITLTGAGFGSSLWVTPLAIDFGPVEIGTTSATQAITITNTGGSTLGSFAGGGVSAPFSAGQSCASEVAPGASCQYVFTFAPQSVGFHEATSSSATNAGPFTIRVQGSGI